MFLSLIVGIAFAHVDYPDTDLSDASWDVLADSGGWVGCTEREGVTWCRSIGTIPASALRLEQLLEDFPGYVDVFDRVSMIRVLEPNVVHVLLDMPFPFLSRDYIARFVKSESDGDVISYTFESEVHQRAPELDSVAVRLPNAAGRWKLEPLSPSSTRVTYTWNAELGGDIPTWALGRARRTQGLEVMGWLTDALD